MSIQQIPRTFAVPLGAALTGAAISLVTAGSGTVNVAGFNLPGPVAYGIVIGSSSGVTELSKNYIVPMITNDPLGPTAAYVLQPAITGLSAAVFSGAMSGFRQDVLVTSFLVGAVSQLVGDYAGNSIDGLVKSMMPPTNSTPLMI